MTTSHSGEGHWTSPEWDIFRIELKTALQVTPNRNCILGFIAL
jgi:hypothetical protein